MKNRTSQRIEEISTETMIVGVDVAKKEQWARFVDYRGIETGKAMKFKNNLKGFESIITEIQKRIKLDVPRRSIKTVIIGMEPTGHYWKPLANYLIDKQYRVVCVNPAHVKQSKELDDNSPAKSDKKDAITIARLVRDGRFFDPYMPDGVFGGLRITTNTRLGVLKRRNAVKNRITALLDEYFPELCTVFKKPLEGKASRQILRSCPFPAHIMELGEEGVLAEVRKAVKKSVGMKKVRELVSAATESIGVRYSLGAARMKLDFHLEELDMLEEQLDKTEVAMESLLLETGYADQILGIKGIGIIMAASFLGEVGDPLRFQNARQIARYAGYNLVEESSGQNKSGTRISKRGRKQLRSILYQMAFSMVGNNSEMKALYKHLTTRKDNPLKGMQALVVVSKKIITVIHSLLKKQESYKPELVFGPVRKELMKAS